MFWRKRKSIEKPVEFEVLRRCQLLGDLKLWDAALRSLTDDLRDERMRSGLASYQELPTAMKSPKMQALQLGLIQLSNWHSQALAEYASLV